MDEEELMKDSEYSKQEIQDVDQYLDSQIHHLQVAKEMIQNVSDKIYQGLKDKENLDKN